MPPNGNGTNNFQEKVVKKPVIKAVHTYTEDMAKALEVNEGGMVRKMILEQEQHEKEKANLSPESLKNRTFMLVSVILFVLAICALIAIAVFRQQIFTVEVSPQFTPIIFTDKTQAINITALDKDKMAQTVDNEVNLIKVKKGGIEGIYLQENKKTVGFRRFLTLIKANLTIDKITFVNDNFLLGVLSGDRNSLFILLKTRSFADIFPGMIIWEKKMFYDLHGFFGIDINVDINYLLTKNFEDGVIQNKNARILRDSDGQIVLMYIFADDNSVLITNTENATNEVILRLASSQIKQ